MDELAKRRALRRRRGVATGLLLFAAVVFVGAQFFPATFATRLASAAAEAALVGGLADWFAVTALFRRPLGLPIPHTALIPTRKDEIGRALGNFVRDNFLDPQLVIQRLRADNRALQLAHWLDSARAADFAAERVLDIVPLILERSRDQDIRRFVGNLAQVGLQRMDVAPLADAAINALLQSGKHMEVVDGLAAILESSLGALKVVIVKKVGEHTGRFFPRYFDRKIGKGIVEGTRNWLAAIRQPGSTERVQLDAWIALRLTEFRRSPEFCRLVAEGQSAMLNSQALSHALEAIWDEIKREILADIGSESPRIAEGARRVVRTTGALIAGNPSIQASVNAALESLVVDYIAPWRAQISAFIAEVVQGWDAQTVSELIELEVGSDLQYVRINGTVVGALIGTLLFLTSAALSGIP